MDPPSSKTPANSDEGASGKCTYQGRIFSRTQGLPDAYSSKSPAGIEDELYFSIPRFDFFITACMPSFHCSHKKDGAFQLQARQKSPAPVNFHIIPFLSRYGLFQRLLQILFQVFCVFNAY